MLENVNDGNLLKHILHLLPPASGVCNEVLIVTYAYTLYYTLIQNFIEKPTRTISEAYAAEMIHFKTIPVSRVLHHFY